MKNNKNNKNNLVFILVPSKIPSGPIKGAFAIANGLVNTYQVKIIYLNINKLDMNIIIYTSNINL